MSDDDDKTNDIITLLAIKIPDFLLETNRYMSIDDNSPTTPTGAPAGRGRGAKPGRGRGRGRGGRRGDERPKVSEADLDAEMEDYQKNLAA